MSGPSRPRRWQTARQTVDDLPSPALDDLIVAADTFAYLARECDVDLRLLDTLDILASMGYVLVPGHGASDAYFRMIFDAQAEQDGDP